MLLSKACFGPFEGANSGATRLENCESLRTHLKNKKMITEKYLVRRFLSTQQSLEEGGLENAYWLPRAEKSADGLTNVRSDMDPPLRLLESGRFYSGQLRPPEGVAWKA